MKLLIDGIIEVFEESGFKINWAKGKTEAIVKYRGKNAVRATEALAQPDGARGYQLPVTSGASILHVVRDYKHVGSYIEQEGNLCIDARHRASLARNAYGPIAGRVFGSGRVSVQLKI
eukprot:376696-Karenia_brevis.AAC.1